MQSKFKSNCAFGTPEKAAQELIRIAKLLIGDKGGPHTYTGIWNSMFTRNGGSLESYAVGRDYAIENSWIDIDPSGTRVKLLPAGEDA